MPIIATNTGGGDFENPAAGSYIARCYKLVDAGTQPQTFQGKPSAPKRKLYVWWELLQDEEGNDYRMENGQPFSVLQRYTLSTNPRSNLRKDLDAWRGKAMTAAEAEAFDVEKLLGKYCRLQISITNKEDRSYVNIASIGFTKMKPAGIHEPYSWSVDGGGEQELDALPEWLQTIIRGAAEMEVATPNATATTPVHTNAKGDTVIEDLPDDGPVDLDGIEDEW